MPGGVRCRPPAMSVLLAAVLGAACELTELTITAPEDVIIAETVLILDLDPGGDGVTLEALTYLHRTQNRALADEVAGARVTVSGARGSAVQLAEQDSGAVCLYFPKRSSEIDSPASLDVGSCYSTRVSPSPFAPGEELALEVVVPDGRVLTAVSRVPREFAFQGLSQEDGTCRMEPETNYRLAWTPADGTWAYIADARIEGLPESLADREVEAPDSLYLLGLRIGREDTEIIFPRQFGAAEFFQGEYRELIPLLKDGLPRGTRAAIALVAADRNWVNWVRGGNFNPSGQIRIPSVFGDGTGSFGTATQRRVSVTVSGNADGMPPSCGPPEPSEAVPDAAPTLR